MRARTAGALVVALLLAPVVAGQAEAAPKRKAARAFDFDGNGKQDLVAGSPGSGRIAVAYSGTKLRRSLVAKNVGAYASADLDQNGYADLVINRPGSVLIVYGSKKGLRQGRADTVLKSGAGKVGARSVRVADTDGDGVLEVVAAVGAGFWIFEAPAGTGVSARYFPVTTAPAHFSDPEYDDTWRTPQTYSIVTGDFNGDHRADVALLPLDGGWLVYHGSLYTVYAWAAGGAKGPGALTWMEDHTYGGEVGVAGDYNGDGYTDLARGVFHRDGTPDTGDVTIAYGGPKGLLREAVFNEDTPGVPGQNTPDSNDGFGRALSTGDVNGDGRDDLAIGNPYDIEGTTYDGENNHEVRRDSTTVLLGSRNGLTTKGARRFTEATPGVPGKTGGASAFGAAVRFLDVSGDGRPELVIGVPGRGVVYTLPNRRKRLATSGVGVLKKSAYKAPLAGFGAFLP